MRFIAENHANKAVFWVWSETKAQGEITFFFLRIILKTLLFPDFSSSSPCQFRQTFRRGPFTTERRLWTRFRWWFGWPHPSSSWCSPGTTKCQLAEKQPAGAISGKKGQLVDCLFAFAAIWSPGLRWWCGLRNRTCTETSPETTVWDFLAWKLAATWPEPSWCRLRWWFCCQTF